MPDAGAASIDSGAGRGDVYVTPPPATLDGSQRSDDGGIDGSIDGSIDGFWDTPGGEAADLRPDASAARAPKPGEVVIAEALVNPGGSDLGREWIEITSLAPEPVSLAQLHLADAAMELAIPAGVLEPGAFLVLGQSGDLTKNGGVAVDAVYGTRLVLNNEDEQLSICIGPCGSGLLLDQVSWQGVGVGYDRHAMIVDRARNQICPAAESFGTAGDFGTPGRANPPCDGDATAP